MPQAVCLLRLGRPCSLLVCSTVALSEQQQYALQDRNVTRIREMLRNIGRPLQATNSKACRWIGVCWLKSTSKRDFTPLPALRRLAGAKLQPPHACTTMTITGTQSKSMELPQTLHQLWVSFAILCQRPGGPLCCDSIRKPTCICFSWTCALW